MMLFVQHFVSCALCKNYFSKHRPSEAHFCNECKCHVCSNCNCQVYHLSYQEELWAVSEEKAQATQTKAKSKKSKKQKKKDKDKKKAKKNVTENVETSEGASANADVSQTVVTIEGADSPNKHSRTGVEEDSADRSLSISSAESRTEPCNESPQKFLPESASKSRPSPTRQRNGIDKSDTEGINNNISNPRRDDTLDKSSPIAVENEATNARDAGHIDVDDDETIDLVLYLQQTGSIIALAKLMDALEYDKPPEEGNYSSFLSSEGLTMQ